MWDCVFLTYTGRTRIRNFRKHYEKVKVVAKIITGEDERVHCTHNISWRLKCKKYNWSEAKTSILTAGSRTAFMRWE